MQIGTCGVLMLLTVQRVVEDEQHEKAEDQSRDMIRTGRRSSGEAGWGPSG